MCKQAHKAYTEMYFVFANATSEDISEDQKL